MRRFLSAAALLAALVVGAIAQDKGTLDPKPLPPLEHPDDPKNPAKQVFGRILTPTEAQTRSIGFYSRGCIAGAQPLPLDGDTWRVMRISRNRYWGNPVTIDFLERFSKKAAAAGVWPGILVGDIWLTPMPANLTKREREEMSAVEMVRPDGLSVDPEHWSERQAGIIRFAAEEPQVTLIFVNAAIKKALCEKHAGEPWMNKVRPWWGHDYHFHVRIRCPEGETACQNQGPPPPGDGCDKSL